MAWNQGPQARPLSRIACNALPGSGTSAGSAQPAGAWSGLGMTYQALAGLAEIKCQT